ncbi:hypothetical protein [Novacetimonas maltaceti]|uniref:Excisionase n=1 Tax=Novacetimonas maltaceti TaxID=1203393 RepID=A0A2S3VX87_9PROT|nr:hypothetical protein [Novacetimonas maltaceti]POF61205.1 hypothetical protein KMAL_31810 [Novacetimonas maltaceti]
MPNNELVGYKAIAHFFGWEVGGLGERRVLYLSQAHGMPVIRSGTGTPVRADPKALRAWVEQKKQESRKKQETAKRA